MDPDVQRFDKEEFAIARSVLFRAGASGNGLPGGVFSFRFDIVPGDTNGTGGVAVDDVIALRYALGTRIGDASYSILADLNGSGVIALNDLGGIRENLGRALPELNPAVDAVPTSGLAASDVDAIMRIREKDDKNRKTKDDDDQRRIGITAFVA